MPSRPIPFNDLPRRSPKPTMVPGTGTQTPANIGTTLSGPPNLGYGLYSRRQPPSVFGRRRRRRRKAAAAAPRRRKRRAAAKSPRKRRRRARLVKGSAAARRYMAKLRAKRRR